MGTKLENGDVPPEVLPFTGGVKSRVLVMELFPEFPSRSTCEGFDFSTGRV